MDPARFIEKLLKGLRNWFVPKIAWTGLTRKETGREGERIAARLLEERGYRILARNFRSRRGEVDIVAMDGETLVFVEVRTKRSDRFGPALLSVGFSKQRRIRRVAQDYLARKRIRDRDCRFDVVTLDFRDGDPIIDLIRNAF